MLLFAVCMVMPSVLHAPFQPGKLSDKIHPEKSKYADRIFFSK